MIKTLLATWAMLLVAPTGLNLIQEQFKENIAPTFRVDHQLVPKRAVAGAKLNLLDESTRDGDSYEQEIVFAKGSYTFASTNTSYEAIHLQLNGQYVGDFSELSGNEPDISGNWAYIQFEVASDVTINSISLQNAGFSSGEKSMIYAGSNVPTDALYQPFISTNGSKANLLDESDFKSVGGQNVHGYVASMIFEPDTIYTFATTANLDNPRKTVILGSGTIGRGTALHTITSTQVNEGWTYAFIEVNERIVVDYVQFRFITGSTVMEKPLTMIYAGEELPEDSFYSLYDPNSGLTGPVISGSSGSYFANVDNPVTVEYLQSFLIAWDETDGDLTDQIQVSKDEYTGNERKVGEYEIVFSVSDKAGNESTFTLVVYVQDKSKPVITGPQTQRISYTEPTTAEALKSQYSVSDNVDTNLTLAIESDTYTENASVPGTYRIIYAATDSSENKVTYVVDVTVIDDVAPTITGADKVEKSLSSILTSEEIIAEYTATDEIDGECTITIQKDDYAGNGNKVGNYQIILQASDKSNNVATKTITVTVFDDIKPIWYIKTDSNIVINVDETLKLTETDIKRVLAREDYYNPSEVTVFKMTDVDGYFANGDEQVEPGEYDVVYNIKKQNGESEDVAVTLKVRSVAGEDTEKPEEENVKNWFEKNFDFKEQTWGAILVEVLGLIILISIIAGIIKRRR